MPCRLRRTTRLMALASIALVSAQLPGCITSESSKYERHLTTLVAQSSPETTAPDALAGQPALAAVGDEPGP
jgi:hypothetical protein